MKKTLFCILVFLSFHSFALTVDEAYEKFYNSDQLSSNHCGRNINLFLNYLKDQDVLYKKAYVVSVHEDFGMLNLFNARWGSREAYADGDSYLRANYFFHVFAIIDGKAYDFSYEYAPNLDALTYITNAYLPAKKTANVFFQGVLTPEKLYEIHHNTEMRIYDVNTYMKNHSGKIYEGSLVELFYFLQNKGIPNQEMAIGDYQLKYTSRNQTDAGTYYTYPAVIKDGVETKLMADAVHICRAYGYMGADPGQTKHEVSHDIKMYKIYSFLKSESEVANTNFRISFKEMESEGAIPSQPLLHYAKEVFCTDLYSVLNQL